MEREAAGGPRLRADSLRWNFSNPSSTTAATSSRPSLSLGPSTAPIGSALVQSWSRAMRSTLTTYGRCRCSIPIAALLAFTPFTAGKRRSFTSPYFSFRVGGRAHWVQVRFGTSPSMQGIVWRWAGCKTLGRLRLRTFLGRKPKLLGRISFRRQNIEAFAIN